MWNCCAAQLVKTSRLNGAGPLGRHRAGASGSARPAAAGGGSAARRWPRQRLPLQASRWRRPRRLLGAGRLDLGEKGRQWGAAEGLGGRCTPCRGLSWRLLCGGPRPARALMCPAAPAPPVLSTQLKGQWRTHQSPSMVCEPAIVPCGGATVRAKSKSGRRPWRGGVSGSPPHWLVHTRRPFHVSFK